MRKKKKEVPVLHRAYKIRIYPNELQKYLLEQSFGCRRFVYNYFLGRKKEHYQSNGKMLSFKSCQDELNLMKQTEKYSWLKVVDKFALANALFDLEEAFTNFFRERQKGNFKQGFPKFKKKGVSRFSYGTNMTNGNIKFLPEQKLIQFPKVGKVSYKGYEKLQELQGQIKSATVSRTKTGKYFISILTERKVNLIEPSIQGKSIGLDLGLTHFFIDSDGNKVENPKYYHKAEKRLSILQRRLSRKEKGSKNREKARLQFAKLHEHIANIRKDFLHKQSIKLVNENQVIVLEDLYVKGMIRNKRLAKSIQDVGWGYFKQFVLYKANWYGKKVVLVDRFFPSSKLCNECKTKNIMLSLNDREWVCPNCGSKHDRDVNAAKNILEQGLSQLV